MSEDTQWYTNKDLFERLMSLKDDFSDLRSEMSETRLLIKNYNGLRGELHDMREKTEILSDKVDGIINSSNVKKATFTGLRVWLGWVFGLITLIILLYTTFKEM